MKWTYFPHNQKIPAKLVDITEVFSKHNSKINSATNKLASNDVLNVVGEDLKNAGFRIEYGKKRKQKIHVPVLYGECGASLLSFDADAYHEELGIIVEIEAGQAVDNYKFLKDFFEACCMDGVSYLCIAVREIYGTQKDYNTVCKHFDAIYSSQRLSIPLKGILIIGY